MCEACAVWGWPLLTVLAGGALAAPQMHVSERGKAGAVWVAPFGQVQQYMRSVVLRTVIALDPTPASNLASVC